ncbi:MAG: hypothetical protein ABIZ34_00875 [Candidatus Limnocylindrales bacterium]
MTRRGLGRGRLLIGIGAVVTLVSMPLDWFKVGGVVSSLTPITGSGFEGAGIVVFVAAIALLVVLTLPYAARERHSRFDRPLVFLVIAGVALIGYVLRVVQLQGQGALGLPDRAPGFWLAGVGLAILTWGVGEVLTEPQPKR